MSRPIVAVIASMVGLVWSIWHLSTVPFIIGFMAGSLVISGLWAWAEEVDGGVW